jgi:hypothetical protein
MSDTAVRGDEAELAGRAYLRLVLLGALIGIPAALLAAVFLAFVHELEHWLWDELPEQLGSSSPPQPARGNDNKPRTSRAPTARWLSAPRNTMPSPESRNICAAQHAVCRSFGVRRKARPI